MMLYLCSHEPCQFGTVLGYESIVFCRRFRQAVRKVVFYFLGAMVYKINDLEVLITERTAPKSVKFTIISVIA